MPHLPPHDLNAERAVLASMLLQRDVIDEVAGMITAQHFYLAAHQTIYRSIWSLYAREIRTIDAVTLSNELAQQNQLESIGGDHYLIQILDGLPHAGHAKYYAGIVRDHYLQRNGPH